MKTSDTVAERMLIRRTVTVAALADVLVMVDRVLSV